MSYYLSPPLQLFMEWQNMRYSQEFKDNVVARLLSKELSISEAVERYSIGKSTISYWLKIAREQAVCGTLPNKGNPKLMTSLKLAEDALRGRFLHCWRPRRKTSGRIPVSETDAPPHSPNPQADDSQRRCAQAPSGSVPRARLQAL